MAVDPINGDILSAKVTSNDGVREGDDKLRNPGANDSLSGTNVTEPFSGSIDIGKMGGWGGMKKSK